MYYFVISAHLIAVKDVGGNLMFKKFPVELSLCRVILFKPTCYIREFA